MNVLTRGMRNAFRNVTRTVSIITILGLTIGMSLIMFIAYQAVEKKIGQTLSSIGNTITIAPAGFVNGSAANNALTTSQLAKVRTLEHVIKVTQSLVDHVQTVGTTSSLGAGTATRGGSQSSGSDATTNLKSPIKLNRNGGGSGFAVSGDAPALPDNFSLPISVVGANNVTDPSIVGASSLRIVSGKAIDGTKDTNDVMVSKAMAEKNGLSVGSTFTAYGQTLKVAAIFEGDTESSNGFIIAALPTVQRLSGKESVVTSAVATVDSLDHLSSATAAVKKQLGSSADVTSNIDQANKALQPLKSVKAISLYGAIGSVVAGAVIILLTTIMIVRERRREIGILKAIGGSNLRIMVQFMSEALTFTLLGGVVGLAVGIIGGNPVTAALVSNSDNSGASGPSMPGGGTGVLGFGHPVLEGVKNVQTQIDWTVIAFGLGAAVFIALIGSALASYIISKIRPAEVLRSE